MRHRRGARRPGGLAAQAGIPLPDVCQPTAARGARRCRRDAVCALSLVPIGVDAELKRLHVACAAPVPRMALGALELTGWSIEPLLVTR